MNKVSEPSSFRSGTWPGQRSNSAPEAGSGDLQEITGVREPDRKFRGARGDLIGLIQAA